jgi:hypothetical protein
MTPAPRAAARQTARRDIAWGLAGVVAVQLALAVAVEGPWAAIRDPEYGHKLALVRRQTAAAPGRPLLVSMGSSLTLNGLRPELLPSGPADPVVFNFGLTRHGPVQQMLAFDRLLRDGVRPRCVTVELIPQLLCQGKHELDPIPTARHTWGDVEFLYAQGFRPLTCFGGWLEARAASGYTSRFALMSRLWPSWVPWAERADFVWTHTDSAGWLPCEPPRSAAEGEAIRAAAGQGGPMRSLYIVSDSVRAVELTLARCRADGIESAMVMMPEAAWSRRRLSAEGIEQLAAVLAHLRREFDVHVIDARDWCRDDDFRDGAHLLAAGAAQFTERFGREVVPLLTEPKNASVKRR